MADPGVMGESKALVEEAMEMLQQMGGEAQQKVDELRELNECTVHVRNFVAVLGLAFSPLIMVLLFGLSFLLALTAANYGAPMFFVWLSGFCGLYTFAVSRAPRERRSAKEDVGEGFYARVRRYAAKLKEEASIYDDPPRRAAFCQMPWLAAVALLGLETSVAASSGYMWEFLQAFLCMALTSVASGLALHRSATGRSLFDRLDPPGATDAELLAATLARCPWVWQALAALAVLAEPLVEESSPSAVELQAMGEEQLQKASGYLCKVESLRTKLQRKSSKVLDTAVSIEKVLGGTAAEREESMKDLSQKAASNVKGLACAATKLLGVGPQEGEEREEMKAVASASGNLVAGAVGLALNASGVNKSEKPASQAEQAMRGGLQLLSRLVVK
ncbi:unnamed protein product [Durusdinium trenchii]|uniref:Uncharacterized protein n=2 Tax=Durusdinium trenchii TaxID=1381693 RepID=A0ABP0ITE4_9DINO